MDLWSRCHHSPAPVSLDGVEAFDVSDVYRMIAMSPQDEFPYGWGELPNAAPPFRRYFMFDQSHSNWIVGGVEHEMPRGEMGFLFSASRTASGWNMLVRSVGGSGGVFWQPYVIGYQVSESGSIVSGDDGRFVVFGGPDQSALNERGMTGEDFVNAVVGIVYPAVLATSIMHCKNVAARRVSVPPKLAAANAKRGRPRYSYSVLDIGPLKRVLSEDGGMSRGNSFEKALHVCRGHFKDYRDGGGLFGRHRGIFWWEQAMRGNIAVGIRDKDYKVLAGAAH
jgi:hypothetical protein